MVQILSSGHTACAGCPEMIAFNILSKVCPKETIACIATGCTEIVSTAYPTTAWNINCIHVAFENASAVASGVEKAIKKLRKNWKVLAITGDGGGFDIGLQAMSGMFERGHKVTQICLDNECYANTGIQRSSATPYGASTTTSPAGKFSIGNTTQKKPIAEIAAAHKIPYVATASISYPQDLLNKFKKALEKQPSFLHIQCPCPISWRFDSSQTINIGKLAVETGMWVLYEIEDGVLKISKKIENKKPVEEYLKIQGRFKHLQEKEIKEIQSHVNEEWKRLEKWEKSGVKF